MVFNTITVGAAVTPAVIETYFSHYLNRKPLHQKPTAHVSYHEGLKLIRQFMIYASHHTVEDIQRFTSQWVPSPRWIKTEEVTLPEKVILQAAETLITQLGHKGVDRIGGENWWQWREKGSRLKAEWIEMRRDFNARRGAKSKRVMLYVHGGAYFFGSVDEHRYQLQRHARKLEAKVLAPRYRLSPQFPFPCGLHDCLAAYLYLLTVQNPSEIILAGDSAGGGMVISLLVILRDQNIPLPAGAILISPWVDLTHSFPSVAGENDRDFIPSHGFLQKPSMSWPPPNSDDMMHIAIDAVKDYVGEHLPRKSSQHNRLEADEAVRGISVDENMPPFQSKYNTAGAAQGKPLCENRIPGPGHDLSILLDGKLVEIKDQIQMYTTNQLISHPLVSPILQPSLGGLPPLMILTGGGEVLRDEQIYLAHKAANPQKYVPSDVYLDEDPDSRAAIAKWKPTDVQLQVWDDLCHVAPTLSFTRPAKFMYRSIAQFGAWALARAQQTDIEIQDDDDVSVISSGSDVEDEATDAEAKQSRSVEGSVHANGQVGKAGDTLPPFKNHMIRQRVDRHGNVFPLEHASSMPALKLSPDEIGVIKPGPVSKWLKAKSEWDTKYAREKRRVRKQRAKEMAGGYEGFGDDEAPPPSALAGRRHAKMAVKEERKGRSWGMSLWSLWGSSHDENTMEREEKADRAEKEVETTVTNADDHGANANGLGASAVQIPPRSKSRRRTVSHTTQYAEMNDNDETTNVAGPLQKTGEKAKTNDLDPGHLSPPIINDPHGDDAGSDYISYDAVSGEPSVPLGRPAAGPGKAFPFKLGTQMNDDGRNASTVTLESHMGAPTVKGAEVEKHEGNGEDIGGAGSPVV